MEKKGGRTTTATYPTLQQAKTATRKEHLKRNERQWKALKVLWRKFNLDTEQLLKQRAKKHPSLYP